MKTKFTKRLLSWVMAAAMVISMLPISAMASGTSGNVARIGEQEYATLDEAVADAADGATIELLADATTKGWQQSKNLTIKAAEGLTQKPKITFDTEGLALWGVALEFENIDVVMNGIGATPYGEWKWMAICASKDASLTLDNVNMTMDATGASGSPHAIYFCQNNVLNVLNGSNLTIKNYANDALEWDGGNGGYNVNITESTFVSDHNRSGFTGTFYATITDSDVDVINSTGNGSNGSNFIIDNSTVDFNNNGSHGLSAGNLTIRNHSIVNGNDNGMYGITYTGTMSMDGTSELNALRNALANSGGGMRAANTTTVSTVADGAKVTIQDNGHNGLENYGTFTFADGVELTITGNDERTTNGGGIFNGSAGNMTLPVGAVITNNHAHQTGGGICNAGTITLPAGGVELYNNHSDQAGDDIYNRNGATINNLPDIDINTGWALDGAEDELDCNGESHMIDGWYDDAEGARWEAHAVDPSENHIEKYEGTTINGLKALKAAHGTDYKDKTSYPGLDKTIVVGDSEVKQDDVAAGDTVNFKLTSNVPDDLLNYIIPDVDEPEVVTPAAANALVPIGDRGHYNLTFHDRMDEELDSNDDFTVFLDSNKNGVLDGDDKELTYLDDYTISYDVSHDGGTICDFEIEMDLVDLYEKGAITDKDIENATDIIVTYTATLDKNAPAGEYKNTAWVTYESGSSSEVIVTVETYGLNIFKYDQATSSNEGGPTGLAGAEFTLTKDGDEDFSKTLTSGQDGTVSLEGLDAGTYYLKETKAPEGYVCSDKVVTIKIPDQTGTDNMVNVNFANSLIPHTGGMGTTMFSIVGGALIATAGVIFVISRKKRARNAA